jgi:hypothetical protein
MYSKKRKRTRTKYVKEFAQAKLHLLEAHRILATSVPGLFTSMTRAQVDDFRRCLKHVRCRRKWAYLQEDAASLLQTTNSSAAAGAPDEQWRVGMCAEIKAYQRIHQQVLRQEMKKIDRKRELRAARDAREEAESAKNDASSGLPTEQLSE